MDTIDSLVFAYWKPYSNSYFQKVFKHVHADDLEVVCSTLTFRALSDDDGTLGNLTVFPEDMLDEFTAAVDKMCCGICQWTVVVNKRVYRLAYDYGH